MKPHTMEPRRTGPQPRLGAPLWAALMLLLTVLLTGCGEAHEPPADGSLLVTGAVEGSGYLGRTWWVVASSDAEAFYNEEHLASLAIEGNGAYRLHVPGPPDQVQLWLVEDLEGDGPSSSDPHAPHSLTPVPTPSSRVLKVPLSGALEIFADKVQRRAWTRWQLDGRAWLGVGALYLLALLVPGLGAWRARHGGERPPRAPSDRARRPRRGQLMVLAAILIVAALLRFALIKAEGCGAVGLTEAPYLDYAFPGDHSPGLGTMLRNPFQHLMRHPPAFVVLVRSLGMLLPSDQLQLELCLGLSSLLTVAAAFLLTRAVADLRAALFAAAITACAPQAVFFSTSLSPHGTHLLMLSLTGLLLIRSVRARGHLDPALWAACTVIGVHTFPVHNAFLAGQVLALLLLAWRGDARLRRPIARCLAWSVPALALSLPPLLVQLGPAHRLFSAEGLRVGLYGFHQLPPFESAIQSIELLLGLPQHWLVLAPIVAGLILLGAARLVRTHRTEASLLLIPVLCVAFALAGLSLAETLITDGIAWLRGHWTIGLLAVTCPLLGVGLARCTERAKSHWSSGSSRPLAALLLLLTAVPFVLHGGAIWQQLRSPGVPDFDAAAQTLAGRMRSGDVLVSSTSLPHMSSIHLAVAAHPAAQLEQQAPTESHTLMLERALQDPDIRRVWYFHPREHRFGRPKIDHERLDTWRRRWLARHYRQTEAWYFANLELVLWERSSAPAATSAAETETSD